MMVDYIVSSLPTLVFGAPAPISWEKFVETAGEDVIPESWNDLEIQLRNAMAEARDGEKYRRPAEGCSLFWKGRVIACFQEKDVMKREELLDRRAQELPPYTRLACLTFTGPDEATVAQRAQAAERRLKAYPGLDVSPAIPAPLERKEDRWRWQLLLRAPSSRLIAKACAHAFPKDARLDPACRLLVDIDAVFLS